MIEEDVAEFVAQICTQREKWHGHIIDRLPPHRGYPEAIRDGAELDLLVRHFLPYIQSNPHEYGCDLLHALYNPLNIASLARELGVPCPVGYSAEEMRARNTDPCVLCGRPVPRYARFGARCECLSGR